MDRYCERCGHQLEERQAFGKPRGVCPNCGFVRFEDPKVAVGVVVELDGGIVLGRRAHEPKLGRWSFPSGYVDIGEVPAEAAAREVMEETGLAVRIDRLLGVYARPGEPIIFSDRRQARSRGRVLRGAGVPAGSAARARFPARPGDRPRLVRRQRRRNRRRTIRRRLS
jgi:8-oxo-dGTP pyrophosphatase MutT (NUDIX family)